MDVNYTDFVNLKQKGGSIYEDDWDGSMKISIGNLNITSLKGIPKIINGSLSITEPKLKTLKYLPDYVNGDIGINNNTIPIDFKDMKKVEVSDSFVVFLKQKSDIIKCKNISRLLVQVKAKKLFFGISSISNFLQTLNERKNKGEDLDELLVEGMNWCTDHSYPEEFWGDIE